MYRSRNWLIDWMIGWLNMVGWLINWLIDSLLIGWLIDWLTIDWLVDIPPKVDWYTTDSWPIYHRHMTDSKSRCVEISTDTRPIVYLTIDRLSTDYRPTIDWPSTDYQPTIDRLLTDYRPTVNRLSTDCWPTIKRLSTAISTAMSTDISVDITHSKQDPVLVASGCGPWFPILYFPIAHNTLCLPPKICINHC